MEKVASTGTVTLKQAGRSMLVEPAEDALQEAETASPPPPPPPPPAPAVQAVHPQAHASAPSTIEPDLDADEEQMPVSPMSMQDGIRAVQHAFTQSSPPPRWPMYVRQAKQFLKIAVEGFDERKYGFASVVDLLRAAGKEGVLRIERDRQGAVRVFPGTNLTPKAAPRLEEPFDVEEQGDADQADVDGVSELVSAAEVVTEAVSEPPIVDVEPLPSVESASSMDDDDQEVEEDDEVNGNVAPHVPPKAAGRKRKAASSSRGGRTTKAAKSARSAPARSRRKSG
jgi:hypothetical protein